MSLTDLDPTGTLSAASSAINLVGAILRTAPTLKNATGATKSTPGADRGLQRSVTTPIAPSEPIKKDPERERRAYETVNYVLREFGSRVCAAGLVNEHALTKALIAASQHVDVRLFSGEANRLFASLAPKLADPLLVNSIFTSIYFIGILVAELTRSLPNYKETYTRLGPKLVQQLFRTAIGEDAFRDNLGANLDAYETLATTAGLLRPTDSELKTFPGFPAFSTSRYSSRSFGDIRSNKSSFDKLSKHFERAGFPQPTFERQQEVGIIRDWRFLDGDTNSRTFDVDKADKNVGENFGRVIHWLVCSADRMPTGQAIIAYYDQHVELIRWIGERLGFALLEPARDLNMTGPHTHLDGRLKSVMNTWVILMFSEKARSSRQEKSARWTEERLKAAKAASKAGVDPSQNAQGRRPSTTNGGISPEPQVSHVPQHSISRRASAMSRDSSQGQQASSMELPTLEDQLNRINSWFNTQLKPQCQVFIKMPPANARARNAEARRLADLTERELLYKLDALHIPNDHPGRTQRKAMIDQAQSMLATVEAFNRANEQMEGPATPQTDLPGSTEAEPRLKRTSTSSTLQSPLSYSPGTSPSPVGETAGFPFQEKRTTVIRRKAPPPPRKFISAKALYDFIPEEGNDEELALKEGENLDIVEKTAALEEEGWCKAKVKGTSKIGLVPLEYLEISPTPIQPGISSTANKPSLHPGGKTDNTVMNTPYPGIVGQPGMASPHSSPAPAVSLPQHSQVGQPQGLSNPSSGQPRKGTSKADIAKVGLAAVGATAGVATFVSTQERGQDEPQAQNHGHINQQEPQGSSEDTVAQGNATTTTSAQGETVMRNNGGATQTEAANTEDVYYDAGASPPLDLSGYGGGFEPQNSAYQPAPIASVAPTDPRYAADDPSVADMPAYTAVTPTDQAESDQFLSTPSEYASSPFVMIATPTADAESQDAMSTGSPFADVSGPAFASGPLNPPTLVEDDAACVVEMTQEGQLADAEAVEYEVADAGQEASLDLI